MHIPNFNIIVNLHPTDGTHWVLVIRREGGPVYYFDSFGVETTPLFLEYVDLGSNERIQQYDESYCGAYCLYMIYHVNDNDNVNDLRSSFANNVNDNDKDIDNDLRSSFTNNVNDNVNYNNNVNDNVNQGTCFADDNFIYQGTCLASHEQSSFAALFGEKHGETSVETVPGWTKSYGEAWTKSNQKGKPNNNSPTNTIREAVQQSCFANSPISVNINKDLQSWLNDDDIITEATFPDNFRCIISGPSECGKTFLLKKTNSS